MCAQGHIYLYFIVWLIYGWSFLQHAAPPFPLLDASEEVQILYVPAIL